MLREATGIVWHRMAQEKQSLAEAKFRAEWQRKRRELPGIGEAARWSERDMN